MWVSLSALPSWRADFERVGFCCLVIGLNAPRQPEGQAGRLKFLVSSMKALQPFAGGLAIGFLLFDKNEPAQGKLCRDTG